MATQRSDQLETRSGNLPENVHLEPPILQNDPTIGYRLNHFMLRIRDPGPSLDFYIRLMGMRTVFKADTGPITVYYLGYPQTPAHRANPATFAEETRPHSTLSRTLGLLELSHYHGSETQPQSSISTGSEPPHLGFNHLGFSVPDVKATVERLRKEGITVIKDVNEGPNDCIPITSWEKEERAIATTELSTGFQKILRTIAFVRDPDGYLVELVPQDLPG